MKANYKILSLLLLLMLQGIISKAQLNIPAEAQKLQAAYKSKKQLSFSMTYTYADAANPLMVTDSASGQFILSGSFYWGKINGLEFMQNQNYAVQVIDAAELVRVALPDTVYPPIMTTAAFDSAVGSGSYTSSIATNGTLRTITLNFAADEAPYDFFSITYDTVTYLMQKMEMITNERDEDTDVLLKKRFAVNYSNYSETAPAQNIFNSGQYFVKQGSEFKLQPPFENYKVFIASPELTN